MRLLLAACASILCRLFGLASPPASLRLERALSIGRFLAAITGYIVKFAGASLAVVLCAAGAADAAPTFATRKLEIEVNAVSRDRSRWLDNRVLAVQALVRADTDNSTSLPGRRVGRLALVDTETGAVQWGERFSGGLCATQDRITYLRVEEVREPEYAQRFFLSEGVLGKITTREVGRDQVGEGFLDYDYTCKPLAQLPSPPPRTGQIMRRLRPEHGFVEYASSGWPEYPAKLHRPGNKEQPVALDALRGERVQSNWPYSPFTGAYFIARRFGMVPPRPPGVYKAWWLYPDGRVSVAAEFDLTVTRLDFYSLAPVLPIRDGFLATYDRTRRRPLLGNIGDSGLYFVDSRGTHGRILAGTARLLAVSPDTCKVAIGHDDRRDDGGSERLTLTIVDTCPRTEQREKQ